MSESRKLVIAAETIDVAHSADSEKLQAVLHRTTISALALGDSGKIGVEGRGGDGRMVWQLQISGSARFTFTNPACPDAWLVEANFDGGGFIRRSEQAMMLAMCGAIVDRVGTEEALTLTSSDGRAIMIPYVLNPDGICLTIFDH
jgi:hypothetical protein